MEVEWQYGVWYMYLNKQYNFNTMLVSINYLALIAAGVASTIIGTLWYTVLFGKQWRVLMGISGARMEEMKKRGMGKMYGANFVATLIMAFVLAQFVSAWNITDMFGAVRLAFWVWLGFIATTMLGSIFWENKSVKLYTINVGFQFVSLAVMTVILALWR